MLVIFIIYLHVGVSYSLHLCALKGKKIINSINQLLKNIITEWIQDFIDEVKKGKSV